MHPEMWKNILYKYHSVAGPEKIAGCYQILITFSDRFGISLFVAELLKFSILDLSVNLNVKFELNSWFSNQLIISY